MRLRAVAAGLLLILAASACGHPSQPAAGLIDGSTPTPEVSGSATLITPQPTSTATRTRSTSPKPKPAHSTSPPDGHKRVVVTEANAGQTIRLRVGDMLEVRLGAEYHPAAVHPGGVLARTSTSGGYPSGQPMVAVFKANAKGQADVESSTDYACLHATPSCALPQQLWSVHVIVS